MNEIEVVYFNNCKGRDHARIFGRDAFFDLNVTGQQAKQALNLPVGQNCVVASYASDGGITFDWYSLTEETVLPDDQGTECRVFFGNLTSTETLSKSAALGTKRVSPFFNVNGHFKRPSVILGNVARRQLPKTAAMATQFDSSHNEAFRKLGAVEPVQHWSSFDVSRAQARKGMASLFVTTIWNFHSTMDEKRRRTPTELAIVKDQTDGTLWYRMRKPKANTTRKTAVAHWDGLQLALRTGIPIVGVLKDVHTLRCSLNHVFDCDSPRYASDGNALWLQLHPRGDVGCDVRVADVLRLNPESFDQWNQRFVASVDRAMNQSASERKKRLRDAPRIPKRTEVTTMVFDRNPDVVAEVLSRADGICEFCEQPAPFIGRSKGTPYLEVHHKHCLADGGEDTVDNAVALCPNCHRESHFG
jgi:5-methylcytosine-specific restriction endonuclease McrA